MCQHILDRFNSLWTFLDSDDVEPTNNASERSLRHAAGGRGACWLSSSITQPYVNPEVGRYAPPSLRRASRYSIRAIKDIYSICTSHIERHNLTIRTFLKRFTRLALGFSKKLNNLSAAVSLHIAYYNFCWRLRENGKSGKLMPIPAMQAGIESKLWSMEDLYDNVMQIEHRRKRDERYARLMEKLRSGK